MKRGRWFGLVQAVYPLLALLVVSTILPGGRVSSQSSGLVCISQGSDSCPSSEPRLAGEPGTKLSVGLVIQGSQAFDSYSVMLDVDLSILNLTSVSTVGGLLQNVSYVVCSYGFGTNNPCFGWLGGGNVHLHGSGSVTRAPTTGLLLTLTFDVLARTNGTSLDPFGQVSPSGWSCSCALLYNSVTQVSSMTGVQGALFRNTGVTLMGDTNGDCRVDLGDLVTVAFAYGSVPGSNNWNPSADLNRDNIVNTMDLVLLATNYGRTC